MKAITREKYGGPSVLEIKELEKPTPAKNEVLVNIKSTTINRTDCGILTGKPFLMRFFTGLFKPSSAVPGTDFAGIVEAVGRDVDQFKIGDRVWGLNDEGLASHAEYMTIRQDKAITHIPSNFSYEEVVACAEGAHYAYNDILKLSLKKEDKVLLNGATGAIGSSALQILKSMGIYVTAVCNTPNLELIKSLGADKTYDYLKEDFTKIDKEKYTFIFDAVGKSSFGKCKHLLENGGTYISTELGPNAENIYLPLLTKFSAKKVAFPIPTDCKRSILYINELIKKGAFKAVIDRYYKPEEVAEAYEYVMSGNKTGNVVIRF